MYSSWKAIFWTLLITLFFLFNLRLDGQNDVGEKYELDICNKLFGWQSTVNKGDLSRLNRILRKAERGEDIVLGAIGGSITMGAVATSPEKRWVNQIANWFRTEFPQIDVKLYNAGIGATNSKYGALRVYKHLLQYEPDIVLFEFSINDSRNSMVQEGSEGLLRQILSSEKKPAVIMLAMMNEWGENVQDKHLPLAQYYDIPFVSLRNLVAPLLKDSIISPSLVLADAVHPNDTGHHLAGTIVELVLERAWKLDQKKSDVPHKLGQPLYSDMLENVSFSVAPELNFKRNNGWSLTEHDATKDQHWRLHGKPIIEKVWHAEKEGSRLGFNYQGTFFALTYYRYKAGNNMANLKVHIDGKEYPLIQAKNNKNWEGQETLIFGKDLPYGEHQVRLELKQPKDFQEKGIGFDIVAIGYGR